MVKRELPHPNVETDVGTGQPWAGDGVKAPHGPTAQVGRRAPARVGGGGAEAA